MLDKARVKMRDISVWQNFDEILDLCPRSAVGHLAIKAVFDIFQFGIQIKKQDALIPDIVFKIV